MTLWIANPQKHKIKYRAHTRARGRDNMLFASDNPLVEVVLLFLYGIALYGLYALYTLNRDDII